MDDITRFIINNQADEFCHACGSYECNGECKDMTISPDTLYQVFGLMERQGGSFARNLARAWMVADGDNQKKIQDAFQNLIWEYVNKLAK